ncbi:hypothetical protein P9112_009255 [Eukaryota sp. TZLM1-RC]
MPDRYHRNRFKRHQLDIEDTKHKLYDAAKRLIQSLSSPSVLSSIPYVHVYNGVVGVLYALGHASLILPEAGVVVESILRDIDIAKLVELHGGQSAGLLSQCSAFGVYALALYIIGHQTDAVQQAQMAISKAEEVLEYFIDDEVLYGRAGLLAILQQIEKILPETQGQHILRVRQRIVQQLIHNLEKITVGDLPLVLLWNDAPLLGAAHGLSGVLHVLLNDLKLLDEREKSLVFQSCKAFVRLQLRSGNFPASIDNKHEELVQWCHGCPGVIPFLIAAKNRICEISTCGDLAKLYDSALVKAIELTWKKGLLTKGPSICHGTSGNGYAFLRYYLDNHIQNSLIDALQFALFASEQEYGISRPTSPHSLFIGDAGVLLYITDCVLCIENRSDEVSGPVGVPFL